jgi:transcriptional regulator with PAS, ATPase and Fis domain
MHSSTEPLQLIGTSAAIAVVRQDVERAARCDAKVLITGESGVGKEVVARLIHEASPRRQHSMVTVNCAALTETLLETELFGHVRGSFTGAYRDRTGVLEQAHRGTIFMDEIGETTPRMQGLLLRFLETGEIQRVGSDEPVRSRVDVRVIAATNRVLLDSVAAGVFREDLYYRLNVIHLEVPPLRERREDIPALLAFFLDSFSEQYGVACPKLCPVALKVLTDYAWPGNIRELKNTIERTVVRTRTDTIKSEDLPPEVLRRSGMARVAPATERARVADGLFDAMACDHASFWSVIYAPFMARDLTRADVRTVVRMGLERTGGNYRLVTELFNIAPQDYKRFLGFLRKFDCQVPFQQFRSAMPPRLRDTGSGQAPAASA